MCTCTIQQNSAVLYGAVNVLNRSACLPNVARGSTWGEASVCQSCTAHLMCSSLMCCSLNVMLPHVLHTHVLCCPGCFCPLLLAGEIVSNHDELMCNFFAQADALATGKVQCSTGYHRTVTYRNGTGHDTTPLHDTTAQQCRMAYSCCPLPFPSIRRGHQVCPLLLVAMCCFSHTQTPEQLRAEGVPEHLVPHKVSFGRLCTVH